MKKYILFLLLLLIIIMPSISLADPFDGGSNTTCISLQNNLKYKASDATKNGEVSILQDFLQSQGYLNTDPTGYFNLATVSASKAFQTANGLTADGSVGPITRAKINAVSCGTVPVSTGTLPAGCILNYKFSPLTGIPCVPTPFSSSPAISGVSGPQQLNVNQSGTWTVTASDRSGGNLSYSVVWGDEGYMYGTSASNLQRPVSQQSATFTYSYANAGLYTPTFTVTNQNGQSAKTSLSVNVGNVTTPTPSITVLSPSSGVIGTQVTITGTGFTATGNKLSFGALGVENSPNYNNLSSNGTTITFTVPYSNYFACWDLTPACMIAATMISPGTYPVSITNANGTSNAVNFTVTSATAPSSVTVLSPNGGETWVKGTTQTIRWSDPYNCTLGQACPAVMSHHDIKLDTYYPPCTTNFCPMYPYHSPYTIVRDISNDSSYDWTVGKVLDSNNNVSDGSYMIQVCKTGTSICDSSDIYFKIVNGVVTNNLQISPASATIKTDGTVEMQALVNNCPTGAQCFVGPLAVRATWTSSNEKIATVAYKSTCPPGTYCLMVAQYSLTAVVTGVSRGSAKITATYTDANGNVSTATALVTVTGTVTAQTPIISSFYPSSGIVGSTITLTGTGFTTVGNKLKFGDYGSENNPSYALQSSDGKTIYFKVPTSNYVSCWYTSPACDVMARMVSPGTYPVSITNANGTSNTVSFTVTSDTASLDTFATCLKNKGAVFYGAFWCPHCLAQKNLFGNSASLLPYVECSTSDASGQTQACKDKKIESYPTWEFADGSRVSDQLSLNQLASKTSCILPN